jgi:uncharacterized protein (TIGR00730 family)
LTFIGSGVERERVRSIGLEVRAVANAMSRHFDTLVFGGSNIGLMEAFARAFTAAGGRVISIVPRWLERHGLVYDGCEPVFCDTLAERKRLMFEGTDAVLCYPGGLGTWDELFDFLAQRAVDSNSPCPPVYLYNWEKYYAPLLLQMESSVEAGFIHPHTVSSLSPFESVEELMQILGPEGSGCA